MSFSNISNWRAVSCLIVPLVMLTGLAVPAWGVVHLTDEATGVAGQLFGAAISELEDLNGDSRGEFLIGAPGDNQNGLDAGAAFYYRSRPSNSHGLQQAWRGVAGEKFGFSVARIGDVSGDGIPDFAVGAPQSDAPYASCGRVYLFWGGNNISATPDLVITGSAAGDQFGYAISAAGDFNGDGDADFIVGAPFKNAGAMANGAAFVIFGANGGPSTDLADALTLSGEIAGDHFGWSVTDAGNFLGTANDCVAVGAPDNLSAGAAYVFEGDVFPGSPDATFDLKILNGAAAAPNSKYGAAVRGIGRWDNDGYDDLAIGAPDCNQSAATAGRVEIVFGGSSPAATGDRYVNGETSTDNLGFSLARVGDVLGSGSDDLLIGAPGYDGDGSDGGRAYLFAGGSSSTNDAGNLTVLAVDPLNGGAAADDMFGYAVASAGLFDDDATQDYAVAAPGGNIGNDATAGYCWVADSGGTVVAAFLSQWEAAWTPAGGVMLNFALSLPASQITGLSLERLVLAEDGSLVSNLVVWSGEANLPGSSDLGGGLSFDGSGFTFLDNEALPGSAYQGGLLYRLTVTDNQGQNITLDTLVGPGQFDGTLPGITLTMDPAWPNPFNPLVSVRFRAPGDGRAVCRVTDLRGRQVATLYTGAGQGQWRTVTWDGKSDSGAQAASGVYLIRLESAGQTAVRRVVLAK